MDENELIQIMTILSILGKPTDPEKVRTVYEDQKRIVENSRNRQTDIYYDSSMVRSFDFI